MSKRDLFKKSSNPMFKDSMYTKVLDSELTIVTEKMTVNGAINKTLILMGIMLTAAVLSFSIPANLYKPLLIGLPITGLILYIYTARNMEKSSILAPLYAAIQGVFVGIVTLLYMNLFDGIVFQAITLTITILFTMLMLFKSGLIKVTEKFRAGVTMAVGAVMIFYLVSFGLSLIGINIPLLHSGGLMGIGISAVIIVIASLNLLLDFDNFEKGAQLGAPKYMEWYFAMGLFFTLIWLYIEILRLLSYLRD